MPLSPFTMSKGTLAIETCTFCAVGALNWKVTRDSSSIRGSATPGKLSGEACAGTGAAESERNGAGTSSCRAAGDESCVFARQVPPATADATKVKRSTRFISLQSPLENGFPPGPAAGTILPRWTVCCTLFCMESLQGKIALVTGSSRGIGASIALALSSAGADVAIHYLHRAEEADAIAAQVRQAGRRSVSIQADVACTSEIARLLRTVEQDLGPVDILVNNAAIGQPLPIDAITEQDWDTVIDTNLKSCFLMTQAVLPAMRARRWGRIVNLSSVAAHVGGVIGPHYAASKAGMLGLTHYYARHLAKEGITAN